MDNISSLDGPLIGNGSVNGNGALLDGPSVQNGKKPAIFGLEQVRLMFSLSDISNLSVANNIFCMALRSGRIIRIDLDHPESVDDVDMPKKPVEIGHIKSIFLDPTGAHLLITTEMGENFYLHYQSTKVKPLSRLKGLVVTSVGWCPVELSRSTGDVLIGTQDGNIYEILLEPSNEYFKREDRYCRHIWKSQFQQPIIGIYAYQESGAAIRKVVATSKRNIWYWEGKVHARTSGETLPVYTKFFEKFEPIVEEFEGLDTAAFSTAPVTDRHKPVIFAWANGIGFLLSQLDSVAYDNKRHVFDSANLLLYDQMPFLSPITPIKSILLTEYHIIILQQNTLYGVNRINNQLVFTETVHLDGNDSILGLCGDPKYSTFWAYSSTSIFEIKAIDESLDIWKTFLDINDFEKALSAANDAYSKDVVARAYGEYALDKKDYIKAAELLGSSSKPFESVALAFLDAHEYEPLQVYLAQKLKRLSKHHAMQKTILACWMVEIYMERLNVIDNSIAADSQSGDPKSDLLKAFKEFVTQHKGELDKDTVYEIIASHNRRDELLYYATSISDSEYVLKYWVRMENWNEALKVLLDQNDPNLVYKYAGVLLINAPKPTVDTWMRIADIDAVKLIPALLTYVTTYRGHNELDNPKSNQAIRFLTYAVDHLHTTDVVVYNTLISLYASNSGMAEAPLLTFLEALSFGVYDFDFALRICAKFNRVQCLVHIYSVMGQYDEAVRLALSNGNIDLACIIADRPIDDSDLRKALWLEVAKSMIDENGLKAAIKVLDKCELLRIEDILALFPDFSSIEEFKEELLRSIEGYNSAINQLNRDMEESIQTAKSIKGEISKLSKRHVLIEPGEACQICNFPLATRKFYVFPCQHAFHFDCLADEVGKAADYQLRKRLRDAQVLIKNKISSDALDSVLTERCTLCGDGLIEGVDSPLVSQSDIGAAAWELS